MHRLLKALVIFVAVEALAVVFAYVVWRLSGGYGATIAEACVNAVAAYVLAWGPARSRSHLRACLWGFAGLLLGFIPIAWLAWRASDPAPTT